MPNSMDKILDMFSQRMAILANRQTSREYLQSAAADREQRMQLAQMEEKRRTDEMNQRQQQFTAGLQQASQFEEVRRQQATQGLQLGAVSQGATLSPGLPQGMPGTPSTPAMGGMPPLPGTPSIPRNMGPQDVQLGSDVYHVPSVNERALNLKTAEAAAADQLKEQHVQEYAKFARSKGTAEPEITRNMLQMKYGIEKDPTSYPGAVMSATMMAMSSDPKTKAAGLYMLQSFRDQAMATAQGSQSGLASLLRSQATMADRDAFTKIRNDWIAANPNYSSMNLPAQAKSFKDFAQRHPAFTPGVLEFADNQFGVSNAPAMPKKSILDTIQDLSQSLEGAKPTP